ncbi:MAG: outer membrane lipoprotein chaperone LolA, partial [Deltaproteobacteria bacterium]
MKKILLLMVGVLPLVLVLSSNVQGAKVDEIADKIQANYEKIQDYQANFVQKVTLKNINKIQKNEGVVYFKKGGKMRWDYQKPQKQEFVSDGETIWHYMPADNQVWVDKASHSFTSKTPSTFLAGMGNLKNDFKIKSAKSPLVDTTTNYLLELFPKEDQPGVKRLLLVVAKDSYQVVETLVYDQFDNLTQVIFSDIKVNSNLPDDLFTFRIPKGAEVIKPPVLPRKDKPLPEKPKD